MKKTDSFFIISNFNTDPHVYLDYCDNYHIYDQSTNQDVKKLLANKYENISFVKNTGHNISDYFSYFYDHYSDLPNTMVLIKGNLIGRHIEKPFFDRVYDNKFYTFLYSDRTYKNKKRIACHLYDGGYLEINNSWYAYIKPHKYFTEYNQLLKFIFKDPVISDWILFSPGACYIVTNKQILNYPKEFWSNINFLISYTYFPGEAYFIERMLHIIYTGCYELNEWMSDTVSFHNKLDSIEMSQVHGKIDLRSTKRFIKRFIKNGIEIIRTKNRY